MSGRPRKIQNVTIMDVAREAGVSYSTVSRVMNNYKHVSPEKRERVMNAMTRLGYVVNQQARSLAGGRSQVVGLLVPEVGNSYIGQIMHGVDDEIAHAQYDLMLYTTHRRQTKESIFVKMLTRGMTDGLILLLPLYPHAYLEELRASNFPYVVVDHQGFDDFSSTVTAANWQGAYGATEYLIELGHRRIGFISGTSILDSAVERLRGYKDALRVNNIPFDANLVVNGDFRQPVAYEVTQALLDLAKPPTAIFASSDLTAFGAIEAVRNRGLSIPDDMSIIGFDDVPEAAWGHPALTTVRQPLREMGRLATQTLLKFIDDPTRPMERLELPTELIIRESCRSIR